MLTQASCDRRTADIVRIGKLAGIDLHVTTFIGRKRLLSSVTTMAWHGFGKEHQANQLEAVELFANGDVQGSAEKANEKVEGFIFLDELKGLFGDCNRAKWVIQDHGYHVLDDGNHWLVERRKDKLSWSFNYLADEVFDWSPFDMHVPKDSPDREEWEKKFDAYILERNRIAAETYLQMYGNLDRYNELYGEIDAHLSKK